MSNSMRSYISNIDTNSFSSCMNYLSTHLQALGVNVSGDDPGQLLVAWAQHLSKEAKIHNSIFTHAYDGIKDNDIEAAMKRQKRMHKALTGQRTWLDIIKLSKDDPVISSIISHPFYTRYQQSGLVAAHDVVQQVGKEFKAIDRRVNKLAGKTATLAGMIAQLQKPELDLGEFDVPDPTDQQSVSASLNQTAQMMADRDRKVFYSTTALGALSDAAAKAVYADWAQAFVLVDAAISRYYIIAYFGLMLDAIIIMKQTSVSAEVLQMATSHELQELMGVATKLIA